MSINSIGPINKVQWPFVAKKLSKMGETWCDGESFLEYNPFKKFPKLNLISLFRDGRGLSFQEGGGAEVSVEEFLRKEI
jgi:hypothetical protein